VIDQLKAAGLTYEQAGALWLGSTNYGDDRDRVLIKNDGGFTYLTNDLAHHYELFTTQGYQKAIKVWGADHAGQVASLQLTVNQLVPEAELEFMIVQLVRLIRGGQEVRMSKRAGVYVTMDDLLAEVDPEVARFFFLLRSADSQMEFDLDLAKEQSHKNPYFYLMYAYVRANSILRQGVKKGLTPAAGVKDLSQPEQAIIKLVWQFADLVTEVAEDKEVHKLAFQALEIATKFHEFYEQGQIITLPEVQAQQKLYFVQQISVAMSSILQLLGLKPLTKM
jgi:arginyl-tRNA synthetase